MRPVVPFTLALAAGTSFAARSAPSSPVPAAAAPDTYEMLVQGEPVGTETVTRKPAADGTKLDGTMKISSPNLGEATFVQSAAFSPGGGLTSYRLELSAGARKLVITATPTDDGFAIAATPMGAQDPLQSEKVAVKPPAYLLDNNLASHLDLLTRAMGDLKVDEERKITAVVPQALQAFPASVRRSADGTATLDGSTVPTRRYVVTIATVREELTARASDGALLMLDVPLQRVGFRRKGYVAATAADAGHGEEADPREKATTVKSAAGALPATLLVPSSHHPVAGVVLLSGSGPNDADETIGPNKPFRDLARGLGDRGIATLRFDKRTHVVKDPAKLGDVRLKEEYYDDAAVAIAQLQGTPGVDPKRVFVLGHSEGASIAPKVAQANTTVRGLVMMAPATRPIDALIIEQSIFGAKLTGRSDDEIAAMKKDLETTFAAIKDPTRTATPPFMGASAAYWREIIALDVPALVAATRVPILVVQGEKDVQVKKDADFDLLKSKVGTKDGKVAYKSFPGLNHLFMPVERESTGAEYGIPGRVDPSVIAAIADWLAIH